MRFFRLQTLALAFSLLAVAGFLAINTAPIAYAQSNISGDITGTVSDASGAALPGAQVTVTNAANGQVKTVTSDKTGGYRVPLLSPGKYKVSITSPGFETTSQTVTVAAGTVFTLNVNLTVGKASTTVEVSGGEIQTLHTDDAQISTSFDIQQIQNLPNPGNDLTFVAQTAPGAVMNTQGGYGNFSMNGLPATSNTFTVNGGYEGDPYLNLNNSGASNLTLGNNDVETVTVTSNSYDAAFGGLGGAQVSEISRSGGNAFHGNATWYWNGSSMNATSFFNKYNGDPKSFDNANQWAGAVGGPIKKNKLFFFFDTEGLRVLIPEIGPVIAPNAAYQAAILNATPICPTPSKGPIPACASVYAPYGNLAYNGTSSQANLYKTIFSYFNNATGYSKGALDPYGDPAMWKFNGHATSFAREWLINDRVDWNISEKDHLYIHSKVDQGTQPTQISFLSKNFFAESPQPSYEGQMVENHTFSPNITNQFLFAASYYRALFVNNNAKQAFASVPFTLIPEAYLTGGDWDIYGDSRAWVGGADYAFPQGRMVTGYQFNDDLTWIHGKHNFKFGYAFRRDDITDYTSSEHLFGNGAGENVVYDEGDFAAGYTDAWVERFPTRLSQPVSLYVSGAYVQDQWKPIPNLTLTLGLRAEHNSNPLCRTNCVSEFSADFNNLAVARQTPYNQLMSSGRKRAFFKQQNVAYEPRVGFAYLPGGAGSKTTIRGGIGMFTDYFPAQIMGNLMTNLPVVDRFTVLGAAYGYAITLDPNDPTYGGHTQAAASNTALQSLYSKGGYYRNAAGTCPDSLSIYCATNTIFARPTVVSVAHNLHLPTYEEWSLALEHQFFRNTTASLTYTGNHSYHQPVARMPNAYNYYSSASAAASNNESFLASLPATRANQALGSVTEYYSGGSSNFNGLQAVVNSRISWATVQFNYVYGHALDTGSNGGFDAFGVNPNGQINPYSLQQNYGNADYDVRHYISANYALQVPYKGGPHLLTEGWEVSGVVFHNSGYPFSVVDGSSDVTYGNTPLAKQLDNNFNHKCGGFSHTTKPCDFAAHFAVASDYGQQRRNQLTGPSYTDFDMDVMKSFLLPGPEKAKLKLGAQIFNVFNHANFQIPTSDVSSNSNGVLYTSANTPTSILGAFLGGDASPRLIEFKATLTF